MVRTKADSSTVAVKAIATSRKAAAASYSGGSSSSYNSPSEGKRKQGLSGNPVCPQETPSWQKPITALFKVVPREEKNDEDKENDESIAEKTAEEDKINNANINGNTDESDDGESPAKKKDRGKGKALASKKAAPIKKNNVISSDEDD